MTIPVLSRSNGNLFEMCETAIDIGGYDKEEANDAWLEFQMAGSFWTATNEGI